MAEPVATIAAGTCDLYRVYPIRSRHEIAVYLDVMNIALERFTSLGTFWHVTRRWETR